jgi:hypothetical protein
MPFQIILHCAVYLGAACGGLLHPGFLPFGPLVLLGQGEADAGEVGISPSS